MATHRIARAQACFAAAAWQAGWWQPLCKAYKKGCFSPQELAQGSYQGSSKVTYPQDAGMLRYS